ncbi:hypothetical protein HZH68_015714 [Vespula germanica]|uniref:Uncharacterized protein n=1 Tax=Vespula germanica TaxID=30212 RepID=A0A834JA35_VESGE|nr:hypothetical protein HZH68_015714 [Vespula germanica]
MLDWVTFRLRLGIGGRSFSTRIRPARGIPNRDINVTSANKFQKRKDDLKRKTSIQTEEVGSRLGARCGDSRAARINRGSEGKICWRCGEEKEEKEVEEDEEEEEKKDEDEDEDEEREQKMAGRSKIS